jgi:uncharacterized RDD family membrane protein YckC
MMPFDFGGYRVLRLLGRGGMGAVYEAEQLETGRRVALKVLGQSIDSEEARKRFLREGRLAASVSHPNSVYIYGTEEVDGAPVIAMELAEGGTLRDLVKKRGTLPPKEAVDVILQVIAGLESAHSAGVLHRDVKPANCFVTPNGAVKVGDFGLSVSTLARSDSQLTASGVMLGTPSYAPPEQLRADELDVRADIYSVGATLYALLTGRAPFEGENAVQVVAAVLDKQPAFISNIRPDVPVALSQVVAQCLEKRRESRFGSYAALREALMPFGTEAPEPAPLGLRFVAGVVDESLCILPYLVYAMALGADMVNDWLGTRDFRSLVYVVLYLAGRIAYFAITEGLWGAGLGKLLCGLRVVRPGHGAPGMARAAVRALLLSVSEVVGYVGQLLLTDATAFRARVDAGKMTFADVTWILFILLFVTMRRSNGYAAVQDLATGTRVVVKARSRTRPRLAVPQLVPPPDSNREIGPYILNDATPIEQWSTAYDKLLRRPVWIKEAAPDSPALNETRRTVSRPGRIRWLAGTRGAQGGWDAYEAPPGIRLTQLAPHSKPWSAVRHWLADLTQEIEAAIDDETLPENVTLDHVWLTSDGRALLLDEPLAGRSAEHAGTYSVKTPSGLQAFLDAMATFVTDQQTLPLHARAFLRRLANGAFDRATFIAGNLHSLICKPTDVTRRRRIASLILAPGIFLLASAALGIGTFRIWKRGEMVFRTENPAQSQMLDAVRVYAQVSGRDLASMEIVGPATLENAPFADYVGKWVSHRYGDFIRDARFETAARTLTNDERSIAKEIVTKYPAVSDEEFNAFDATVKAGINELEKYSRTMIFAIGPVLFGILLAAQAVVNLMSVAAFRTSLALRLFGLCVVDPSGNPVSRARHFFRNLIANAALVGCLIFFAFAELVTNSVFGAVACAGLAIGGAILSTLFLISAIIWPDRSWYDRIAGTRLVLR